MDLFRKTLLPDDLNDTFIVFTLLDLSATAESQHTVRTKEPNALTLCASCIASTALHTPHPIRHRLAVGTKGM